MTFLQREDGRQRGKGEKKISLSAFGTDVLSFPHTKQREERKEDFFVVVV